MASSRDIEKKVRLKACERSALSKMQQKLVQLALEARQGSHSPYSQFTVGAAVQLDNGKCIKGANQENAAYPSGLCAERTALFFAKSEFPNSSIECLAVAVSDKAQILPFPCGSCLQVMAEYEQQQAKALQIILIHPQENTVWVAEGLAQLLPFAFGEKHLPV